MIEDIEGLWAPIAEKDDWSLFSDKLQQTEIMRQAYDFPIEVADDGSWALSAAQA